MFGGCTSQKPAGPNSDLYQLKMGTGNFIWQKLDKGVTGDENAPEPLLGFKQGFPLKRWKHSACVYQKKFIVFFGGFFNSRNRFNDVWFFVRPRSLASPR